MSCWIFGTLLYAYAAKLRRVLRVLLHCHSVCSSCNEFLAEARLKHLRTFVPNSSTMTSVSVAPAERLVIWGRCSSTSRQTRLALRPAPVANVNIRARFVTRSSRRVQGAALGLSTWTRPKSLVCKVCPLCRFSTDLPWYLLNPDSV